MLIKRLGWLMDIICELGSAKVITQHNQFYYIEHIYTYMYFPHGCTTNSHMFCCYYNTALPAYYEIITFAYNKPLSYIKLCARNRYIYLRYKTSLARNFEDPLYKQKVKILLFCALHNIINQLICLCIYKQTFYVCEQVTSFIIQQILYISYIVQLCNIPSGYLQRQQTCHPSPIYYVARVALIIPYVRPTIKAIEMYIKQQCHSYNFHSVYKVCLPFSTVEVNSDAAD